MTNQAHVRNSNMNVLIMFVLTILFYVMVMMIAVTSAMNKSAVSELLK